MLHKRIQRYNIKRKHQMTTLKTFAALAFAAVSGTSFAVPETYDIDPTHTLPRFEYNHMGFTTQQSRFDKISGQITLDQAYERITSDVADAAAAKNKK